MRTATEVGPAGLRALLARHGLLRGPRPVEPDAAEASWGEGMGAVTTRLGPVGVAFCGYLSRRADLLPAAERDALRRDYLEAESEAWAAGTDDARLEELRRRTRDVLAELESSPESSGWSGSWHRGRRHDGRPVRLFVARPEAVSESERGLETLRRLLALVATPFALPPSLLGDFRHGALEPRLDLARRIESWERLGRRPELASELVVPTLVPELTGDGVLAVEAVAGTRGLLEGGPLRLRGPRAARRLGRVFLELALGHGLVADELEIARLEGGPPVLLDAAFTELPAPADARLLDFLRAVASQLPEEVLAAWRREIDDSADLELVRSRLRQTTPRRGGAVSVAGAGESAAEYVVAYWRSAALAGVELGASWRVSLAALEALSRRLVELDPDGDPLADALVEHTWRHGFRELRRLAAPAELTAMAERYSAALLDVPPRLERWLERQDARDLAASREPETPRSLGEQGRPLREAVSLLLAMVSVAVCVRVFGEVAGVEAVGAGLFLVLGAGLLRRLTSGDGR